MALIRNDIFYFCSAPRLVYKRRSKRKFMNKEKRRIGLIDIHRGEYLNLWVEEIGPNQFRTVANEGAWGGPFWKPHQLPTLNLKLP